MNFAKRLCADDANLIEVVEVNVSKNTNENDLINKILTNNEFEAMYRKQTEEMSANGTVGAYIRVDNVGLMKDGTLKGGDIKINYCNSLNIIPLNVENNQIIECAFTGVSRDKKDEYITLVMFTLENGKYICKNVVFNSLGVEQKERESTITLGDVKPFSIMRTAEVNNLDMIGYGFPKLWNAIPNLKILDLSYTMWKRDLEKSDKIVLMNDILCRKDKNGNPLPPTAEMKKIFVQLGENSKLPEENALWQEYNPTVRIDDVTKSFELALSMLSISFGYGTKRYSFEDGRIVSATEYAGDRQDSMQEINKQRSESKNYIIDLVKAIKWMYNALNKASLNIEEEIMIDFDDSYVEDKKATAESMRNDALSFGIPTLTKWYLMKRYNIAEDEAVELLSEMNSGDDGDETEE
ncbi:hypothetical protein ACWG0P_07140 [Amedibacillus sp. YH-ame6]